MKIIIELTLLVSFVCCLFVLSITARVVKVQPRLSFLGGLVGGVVSLIYPLFNLGRWGVLSLFLSVTSCVNLICFKYTSFKSYLERGFLICLLTFLFGGCCLAIENFFGWVSLLGVAGVSLVTYLIIRVLIRYRQRQEIINKFTYKVVLKDRGEEFSLEGFLDSGNLLYDTITKKPIMLVDFEVFHKLYSNISYINVLTKSFDEKLVRNGHYIRVNSLSAGAKMFVFSVEEACIGDKRLVKEPMLGLSLSGFEKSFGRSVLLHGELV